MTDVLKTVVIAPVKIRQLYPENAQVIATDRLPKLSWKRVCASSGDILQTKKSEVQGQNIITLAVPDKVDDLIMNRINQ